MWDQNPDYDDDFDCSCRHYWYVAEDPKELGDHHVCKAADDKKVNEFQSVWHNNYLQFHHQLSQSLLAMLHLLPERAMLLLLELARFDLL